MTDARVWLDQVDARTNAAADGPWAAYDANEGDDPAYSPLWSVANDALATPPDDDNEPWLAVEVQVLTGVRDDAEFIAHARTDLPAATTALRAVLDLHRRIPYGSPALCASAPWVPPFVCEHCLAESDGCVPYPCPTVTAITTALEDA